MKLPPIDKKIKNTLSTVGEIITENTSLQIEGRREILIRGCKSIISYDGDTAEFRCNGINVRVTGKDLELTLLNKGTIAIKGHLCSVEFTGRK